MKRVLTRIVNDNDLVIQSLQEEIRQVKDAIAKVKRMADCKVVTLD